MAPNRGPAWALCTLSSALLMLTGCGNLTQNESDWARAALERNPDLTVVATDEDANTFTVQIKGRSELRVVRADEVIGNVPSDGIAPRVNESAPAPPPVASERPQSGRPEETTASADVPARAEDKAASRTAASPVNEGTRRGTAIIRDSATGEVLASTGGADEATPSLSGAAAAAGATSTTATSGKLLASGPGYSISAGDPRAPRPIRLAEATELKSPSNLVREHRYEPMICQGGRLLHIDGRNLEFEGDALKALDGCEIHITNSHIIAHGVGISARAANVYVKNSIIEGESGSISASDGAKVYTQHSTFKGLSRRLDTASFHDLGETVWN